MVVREVAGWGDEVLEQRGREVFGRVRRRGWDLWGGEVGEGVKEEGKMWGGRAV